MYRQPRRRKLAVPRVPRHSSVFGGIVYDTQQGEVIAFDRRLIGTTTDFSVWLIRWPSGRFALVTSRFVFSHDDDRVTLFVVPQSGALKFWNQCQFGSKLPVGEAFPSLSGAKAA